MNTNVLKIEFAEKWEQLFDKFVSYAQYRRDHLFEIPADVNVAYDQLRDMLLKYPRVDLNALRVYTSVINGRSGNEELWSQFIEKLMEYRILVTRAQFLHNHEQTNLRGRTMLKLGR
jgi:hypothetical protein